MSTSFEQTLAELIRLCEHYTAAELRRLHAPRDPQTLSLEWQCFVNMRAAALEAEERANKDRLLTCARRYSPKEESELDALVAQTIANGLFSSLHALRSEVGCSVTRLKRSLERLTLAGRITRDPHKYPPQPPVWRIAV